jgi:acyl carrier protein
MGVPIEMISGDSSPDTIEEWDSLKHMNLVLALEEEFGIQFTDEQIVEMLSVELIVEVMNEIIK